MMAKKRMVSLQIIDSDDFLELPHSAQLLYFHLLTRTDDEGFTNGVKKIMRMVRCGEDDLKILIGKRFVLAFNSGVVVIKHWLIHNNIRNDRIIPTIHSKEKGMLVLNDVNGYTELLKEPTDKCQHSLGLDLGLDIGLGIDLKEPIVVEKVKESIKLPYKEIITYLNQKLGTSYKSTSNETQGFIKARFNNGFALQDFYKVIDIKYAEWDKTDMAKFLRPSTLFGNKFEGYLNQVDTPKQNVQLTDEELEAELGFNTHKGGYNANV